MPDRGFGNPVNGERRGRMLGLLIVLVVLFLLFGGVGYGYRDRLGSSYTGGTGLLGAIVLIFLLLLLLNVIKL
jgi:hypothetical protein